MLSQFRILTGILLLMILAFVGVVALMIVTRDKPDTIGYDASMSPTAPFILNTQQLTEYAATRTAWATEVAATYTAVYLTEQAPGNIPVSPTSLSPQFEPCGWMWATHFNPELSETLQAEFEGNASVFLARAESFGENCLNADGSIRRFIERQTDFRIFIRIDVPHNDIAAAQVALEPIMKDIFEVLANYPPDETAGPQPGIITLEVSVRNGPTDGGYLLQVDYIQAMDVLAQRLSGAAFFEALGNLIERLSMAPT